MVELTVGCERCHGPGRRHVEKHLRSKAGQLIDNQAIVHPGKLDRRKQESICQQCHLSGATSVLVTGKTEWDFRPGNDLTDFRVDFQKSTTDGSMEILGHVEQLQASACYQGSETLTCVTCHNPHGVPNEANKIEHYRAACLQCHQDKECDLNVEVRMAHQDNDCSACHMPALSTNVPHTAFRHHRIGIGHKNSESEDSGTYDLVPIVRAANLSEAEKQRCEAIAKVNLLKEGKLPPELSKKWGLGATKDLIGLRNLGVADPVMTSHLVWLAQQQGQPDIAKRLAVEVRSQEQGATQARIDATRVLAKIAFDRGENAKAIELFGEVYQGSNEARDCYFLALSENNGGNTDRAISLLRRAIEKDPVQESAYQALAAIYQSRGQSELAAETQELAEFYRKLFLHLASAGQEE